MQYVSLRSSFFLRRLMIGLICFCANTSQPAFGEGTAVGTFVLTDVEISQRCAASIQGHIDMVDADEGNGIARRVPRCVFTYENMRDIAQGYNDAEEHARLEVIGQNLVAECHGQDECLHAAREIIERAIHAHQSLVLIGRDGESRLAEITHHESDSSSWGVADPIVAAVHNAVEEHPAENQQHHTAGGANGNWGVADPIVAAVHNAVGHEANNEHTGGPDRSPASENHSQNIPQNSTAGGTSTGASPSNENDREHSAVGTSGSSPSGGTSPGAHVNDNANVEHHASSGNGFGH
jgi:hypothetical protein